MIKITYMDGTTETIEKDVSITWGKTFADIYEKYTLVKTISKSQIRSIEYDSPLPS